MISARDTNINLDINTVCYQGLPYSYSECAAKSLFNDKNMVYKETFEDVFKDVSEGRADIGVVPVENSTAGYVNEVYDLLVAYDLYINYNYVKKVEHCLAAIKDACIDDIKEVHSHPQALMQCNEYIKKYGYKIKNELNTAIAAKIITEMNNKSNACICSEEAAHNYGLQILEKGINPRENYTRFAAISKKLTKSKEHDRISIVFTVPHEVGTLNNVLSVFTYYNLNLCYIYSRPDRKSPWKYLFYLDFEGNMLEPRVEAILRKLKNELPFIKILGNFQTINNNY